MAWNIELYETPSGQPVVESFIGKLQPKTQAKLIRQIELLEEFGAQLSMPHAKPMGGGLYELRVRGKQEVRVFYVFAKGSTIYLLHGFIKKTQQTLKKELELAKARQEEINSL